MSLIEVPTLHPTEAEFANPIEYLSSPDVGVLAEKYGMLKMKPPASFQPPLSINKHKFRFVPRLQKLKELNILNRSRLFFYKQLHNFNKMKGLMPIRDSFEIICGKKIYYYDVFIKIVKFYQSSDTYDQKRSLPNISATVIFDDLALWDHLAKSFKLINPLMVNFYETRLKGYLDFLSEKPDFRIIKERYPTSLLSDDESSEDEEEDGEDDDEVSENACLICKKNNEPENTLLCDSCDKPFHKHCLSPPLTKIPKDSWFCDNCIIGNGYYGFKDSSLQYSLSDFQDLGDDFDKDYFKDFPNGSKPNDINEMERIFWELVDNTDNDIKINYGADIHNLRHGEVSGFPTHDYIPPNLPMSKKEYRQYVNHPMNLNNLPFDKNSLLNHLNEDISGMTIPWIYVGNTFSTFCWHVEDQYTLSANYQHFGATKKWYGIPSKDAIKFEQFMQGLAPDLFLKQPDILHQLVTLVSPFKLVENGIDCFTANQEPGEYIITFPRVYHAGFNAGFNFNEAVNFTMVDWLEYGVQSSKDYSKTGLKANVFDIYELMINILEYYKESNDDNETNDDFEGSKKIKDDRLIRKCLDFLKLRLTDEYSLHSTLIDRFDMKPKLELRQKPESMRYDSKKKEEEEEGIVCTKCKNICTFGFVKHFQPIITTSSSKMRMNYLPTPQTSPDFNGDSSSSSSRRSSKRIKLKQEEETFKIDKICLNDFLKLRKDEISKNDEFIIIRELNDVKKLINDVENVL